MSGSRAGSIKASATIRDKYGDTFYADIGAIGGRASHTGGFYGNPELARIAGAKGGRLGKRKPITPYCTIEDCHNKNKARGLCGKHYIAYRRKQRRHEAELASQDV